MQLFYNSNLTTESDQVIFDKEESRHIFKVLRKKEGDIIHITNGDGFIFKAQLEHVEIKQCIASIRSAEEQSKPKYKLHLAVAPTKLNDRYEWFLEKATEIGIYEITPILCDHSERKVIKKERYEKILQNAMKQSLKGYLPILNDLISYQDFISQQHRNQHMLIAHCENSKKHSLKSLLKPSEDATILIGPEGDFSPSEIEKALENGFTPVSLGNSRLRTETAAIVACHSVAFLNED